jgi:tripartite ATP-independent transporter DctP family solute receptor
LFAEGKGESEASGVVWKFSAIDVETSDYIKAYRAMWDRVEKETKGAIRVEIYDLNQLGDEPDVLQSLQTGTIQAAQMATTVLSGYSSLFNVNDLPFVFNDFDHSDRFAKTLEAQKMSKSLEKNGFYVWYWAVLGFRQPNLRKQPIRTIDDFKGLKWRTMESPIQIETMKLLGAIPVTIAYSEVYNALSMGVVDAWMNDGVAFKNLSIYEVAPYYTDIPLFASMQTCVVSKKAFDSLSPENQKIVKRILQEDLPGVIRTSWNQNRAVLEDLKKNYFKESTVITDLAPYLERVRPVYDNLVKKYPECKEIIDAINRVR